MKKRIILAVLMTALIVINVFCSSQNQEQAEQETENTSVSSSASEKVNTEQATVIAEPEKESTTTAKQESGGGNKEITTKPEIANQPDGTIIVDDDKTVSSNKGVQIKDDDKHSEEITVVLSINCENAVNWGYDIAPYLLENEAYKAEQGATAFDVLKALCDENGISLKYQRKTYIQGIGGLNEKDCGGTSGWTYRVNGELITKPASSYVLKNGDVIEWRYVTNSNE